MSKKLRVATTGAGYFSQFQYNAWSKIEEVDLVAVFNRTRSHAEDYAKRYNIPAVYDDLEAMLNETELDILDIITPPVTHSDYVRAALNHDLTVICQKPFTPTLADAQSLVADIEAKGATVVIHENFRFMPWFRQLKSMIDEGVFGDLYQVSFWLRTGDGQGPEAYLNRQPYFQTMERFLIHETGIHVIDVFRFLFGEVSSIFAQLGKLNPVIAGEDSGIVLFNFENGTRGLFDANRLVDHKAENRRLVHGEMLIEGSAASARLTGDGDIFLRSHDSNDEQAVSYDWENIEFAGDCVRSIQQHVVDHLIRGTPLMNTARDYLKNIQIEEAVYRSAETGACVALRSDN
ncbi:MAG: Gfo/Idh/MocA family oxidoreductase [Rhodospirillales bacterium]|nr:Gfo/Idh/MocA family oxidoreductase [Rhodospirillales bacterium]